MVRLWIIVVAAGLLLAGCAGGSGTSSGPAERSSDEGAVARTEGCASGARCPAGEEGPAPEVTGTAAAGMRVAGAAALRDGYSLQKSAEAVHPSPGVAKDKENRPRMHADGCHLGLRETEPPECVYGDPSSEKTVVLFGDSHAMQWFPALQRLAGERGWRLVGFSKRACPPARVEILNSALKRNYRECAEWREGAIERVVEEAPDLVVTSSLPTYRVREGGQTLEGVDKTAAFEDGYVSTLEDLRSTGAAVAVVEDVPHPGKDIPRCVSRSLDDLEKCSFPRGKAFDYPPSNTRAAERVEGATVIDPRPVLCPGKRCPAVIGDALVYRNGAHLTPVYVRTLAPWLGARLPGP